MANGVTLYLAEDVGARDPEDEDILLQNMDTVKQESTSPEFKTAFAQFKAQLAFEVERRVSVLRSSTYQLYRNIATQSFDFEGGSCFVPLPQTSRVESLSLMIDICKPLDLIIEVIEPDYGYVFLPDGRILGEADSPRPWTEVVSLLSAPPANPVIHTKAEFKKAAKPLFEALAVKYGFKKQKVAFNKEATFSREGDGVTQYVSASYESFRGKLCFFIELDWEVAAVREIYTRFGMNSKIMAVMGNKPIFHLSFDHHSRYMRDFLVEWAIQNHDLNAALARLEQIVFKEVLDHCQNIAGLDQTLNVEGSVFVHQEMFYSNICIPQMLILSKLAGNASFETSVTAAEAKHFWGANQGDREVSWPKLLHYLRTEAKPLV